VNAETTTVAVGRDTAGLLRIATAALTAVTVASFAAVGAVFAVVLFVVLGGAITALVRPGRTVVTVLAGLFGLGVVGLAANFLSGGTPEEWGDQLFVYGGGLLGIATVVLAGMTLAARNR
jgi:hypothetical protein